MYSAGSGSLGARSGRGCSTAPERHGSRPPPGVQVGLSAAAQARRPTHTSSQHHGSDRNVMAACTQALTRHPAGVGLEGGKAAGHHVACRQGRGWLIEPPAPGTPNSPEAAAPSALGPGPPSGLARRWQHPHAQWLLTVGGGDTHAECEGLLLAGLFQVHGASLLDSHATESDINLQREVRRQQVAEARAALPRGRRSDSVRQTTAAGAALGPHRDTTGI